MHLDVCKVLRCPVDVSFDVVSSGDKIVTLSGDCCNVGVDGCFCSSGWLSFWNRLIPLSKLFVECSQAFLMSSDAVVDGLSVVTCTVDVVEADWVDLVESRVEVDHEPEVVVLKKAPHL